MQIANNDLPKFVFRGDSRPPDVIYREGFQPKGQSTDLYDYAKFNTPSIFVGTTKSPTIAAEDFAGSGAYVYTVRSLGGIDVNKVLGSTSPFAHELEVAIRGGVRPKNILGARLVGANGRFIGPFIPNPYYVK